MENRTLLTSPGAATAPPRPPGGLDFAKFMELRGRRVVESFDVLWHSVGHGLYMSLPYHRRLDLDPREAGRRLAAMGAIGIRYPSLTWVGSASGLYVCRQRGYDVSMLHRNSRSHVRHGLRLCEIRRLSERELSEDALRINICTMRRQSRFDPEFGEPGRWRTFVRAVWQCPSITATGAFVDGRLAAYVITSLEDGWLQLLYRMTDLEFDHQRPSQVLDYTITSRSLSDPSVVAASMGWAPLIPLPGLHEYKLRLGYDFEPHYSVVQFRPALQQIVASCVGGAALGALRLVTASQSIKMAVAVLDGARLTYANSAQHRSESAHIR